jgi:hypothetical protein
MSEARSLAAAAVAVALVGLGGAWLVSPEAITVVAEEAMPLYAPVSSSSPQRPPLQKVGMLKPGEQLAVVGCEDTKSDLEPHVRYQGQPTLLGERFGRFKLYRHHIYPWQEGAVTTCRGFYAASSVAA